jgi:hypothetical protein
MKLADIDVDKFIAALRSERGTWIKVATDEGRKSTQAETVTIAYFGLSKEC